MKKRFISIVIALVVVVCLFSSMTVSALPLTRLYNLDFTYTGYLPGGELPTVSVDENANYKVEDISYAFVKDGKTFCYGLGGTWILMDEHGAPVSSQTTLPDISSCDHLAAIIDFHTKEDHTVFDETITVTANGSELINDTSDHIIQDGSHGWYHDDDDVIFAIISFPLIHLSAIDNAAVTVPDNIAGKTAESIASQIKIPENTTLEKIEFRDDNGDIITGALPKDAKKANVYIVLKAKSGYCFATIPTTANFNIWIGNDVTVNKIKATKVSVGNKTNEKGGISNQSEISPDEIVYMSIKATIEPIKASDAQTRSPKTGDNNLIFFMFVAIISLLGIGKSAYSLIKSN